MSAEFEFEDKEIRKFFSDTVKRLNQATNADRQYIGLLSSIVYRDVMEHFSKEMGSEGKWEKWSKSYETYLNKIGRGGNKKLQFNGKMRQNFLPTNYRGNPNGVYWFNNAKTKSGFPYAQAHDEGGPKLPKRDFMWLSDKAFEDILNQTLMFMLDEAE